MGLMGSDPFNFDAAWLALREPVDHRSRPAALLPLLATAWRTHHWSQFWISGAGPGRTSATLGPGCRAASNGPWSITIRIC